MTYPDGCISRGICQQSNARSSLHKATRHVGIHEGRTCSFDAPATPAFAPRSSTKVGGLPGNACIMVTSKWAGHEWMQPMWWPLDSTYLQCAARGKPLAAKQNNASNLP